MDGQYLLDDAFYLNGFEKSTDCPAGLNSSSHCATRSGNTFGPPPALR
ncbi:hypothetical protein PO124_24020 [Bacillus licheniformis]|nr:hypothetical protein [Bacillus licheniformis]